MHLNLSPQRMHHQMKMIFMLNTSKKDEYRVEDEADAVDGIDPQNLVEKAEKFQDEVPVRVEQQTGRSGSRTPTDVRGQSRQVRGSA